MCGSPRVCVRVPWAQGPSTECLQAFTRVRGDRGGLRSGLGGARGCGERYSGTAVRIQVQGGMRGCGLGSWSQLAVSKTLEKTRSQTVGRASGTRERLSPTASLTKPRPRGAPVPLGLLLVEPKELEMPLLTAHHPIGVTSVFLGHEFPLGQGPKSPQGWPGPQ